jgi:hypothetical protein
MYLADFLDLVLDSAKARPAIVYLHYPTSPVASKREVTCAREHGANYVLLAPTQYDHFLNIIQRETRRPWQAIEATCEGEVFATLHDV